MNEAVIEARDITKQYKDLTALDHVDITVRRGEIYGLIGDNGAGKSTFLRLFGNEDEKAVQKSRSRMGAIVENAGFFPKMSVEKNLEYYRIQRGIPGKETVESVLRTVNLLEKRRVKCEKLSMGMKQRFGLALALLGEPELLLLDEPINGLDPSGIIEMRELLLKLNQEKRITILLSSHILSELEQIATMYGFLSRGGVLEEISAQARPSSDRTGKIRCSSGKRASGHCISGSAGSDHTNHESGAGIRPVWPSGIRARNRRTGAGRTSHVPGGLLRQY